MIITIARQCGSGGHEVAQILADKLGLELFDKNRLLEEARKLGKEDEFSDFFNERPVNSLLYGIAMSFGNEKPMSKALDFIKEVTKDKNAVIIGRCANIIYKDNPEVMKVFLHGNEAWRVDYVAERDSVSRREALKNIKEVDEKRASFHKFCTGKEWEDASQYQLSIDTGKLDISDAANMIINYINAKNIRQKHL